MSSALRTAQSGDRSELSASGQHVWPTCPEVNLKRGRMAPRSGNCCASLSIEMLHCTQWTSRGHGNFAVPTNTHDVGSALC